MKVLYIGQYTLGTTSRMRGEALKAIIKPTIFEVIDANIPFFKTHRLLRSFGFRHKKGALINNINKYIVAALNDETYDLIWVDKAVFITPKTTALLRSKAAKLVHFTPDPAFTFHKSKLFLKSLPNYDFLVTTKSYELEHYYKHIKTDKVLYATQGFDAKLHKPSKHPFSKKDGFVFIGHYEDQRAVVLQKLLQNDIKITLAGIKWNHFARKHQDNPNLTYLGDGVYGEDYVKTLQNAKMAWGALSKWVPELHTTRTFEIPACGTALVTERNSETASFFKNSDAIFYNDINDLVTQVKYYMSNNKSLETLTEKGTKTVHLQGKDYKSIIHTLLQQILH
ncbi:glycosyltransferase [Flavobacteriaceae bacterium]|nr:glycosyltransferase [Flavobacteriaceae bacterium]